MDERPYETAKGKEEVAVSGENLNGPSGISKSRVQQNTNEGDITRKYFNRLEKQIKTEPSQWLWSHRRWKHKN